MGRQRGDSEILDSLESHAKIVRSAASELGKRGERIEYGGAEVFLVDNETISVLLRYEEMAREAVSRGGDLSLIKHPFKGVMNLLNRTAPAHGYRFYMRKTPRIITDREKVSESIEKEFSVWERSFLRAVRKSMEEEGVSEEDAARIQKEAEEKIEIERSSFKDVLENFDQFDVFISNYDNAKSYPAVILRGAGEKEKWGVRHLKITEPNVIWYKAPAIEPRRRDASVLEKMKNYQKIGSTIFFKRHMKK